MFSIYRLLPPLYSRLVWQRGRDLLQIVRTASMFDDSECVRARDVQVTVVAEVAGPAPLTTRTYLYPRSAAARRRR